MDEITKRYRVKELNKVYPHSTYKAAIVITGGNGEGKTKYLGISNVELFAIKKLLTK